MSPVDNAIYGVERKLMTKPRKRTGTPRSSGSMQSAQLTAAQLTASSLDLPEGPTTSALATGPNNAAVAGSRAALSADRDFVREARLKAEIEADPHLAACIAQSVATHPEQYIYADVKRLDEVNGRLLFDCTLTATDDPRVESGTQLLLRKPTL